MDDESPISEVSYGAQNEAAERKMYFRATE
jgi:hypothetical protein